MKRKFKGNLKKLSLLLLQTVVFVMIIFHRVKNKDLTYIADLLENFWFWTAMVIATCMVCFGFEE